MLNIVKDKQTSSNTKHTGIRLDKDLYAEIEKLADEYERTFSDQLRYMLKQYLKIIKNK